jgi:hypothetical protein
MKNVQIGKYENGKMKELNVERREQTGKIRHH